ncbi:precorrin-4 C(11)-methyltransferase [Saccharopolyspora rosea]|uniref:precorrin-4 C(11)-methyltransferase n=1 Tax=Saccharopolyspora rosea TaxID=524884 RepID=UPI0021DB0776|nr:precorrin-4 C(11)-methyltransferase [Saccharopolyspora rosea]
MVTGRISFIGAGPGAADLITVRAARRIAEADVVLWSASLVTPECVKEHARADAELVDSAQLSHEQAVEIFRRAERDRLNVVRVHSGDPALWSSVQDQHDACLRMNVEVEIVPGVAPVAAAAAAVGRELTAPEVAQSLVVTRFENGRTPVPDGESVREFARHGTTMAVFTSAARAGRLVEELRSGGYSEDTPVLVAYKVSWPDELLLRTTLGELERTVKQHKLWRNTLFLVGKVLGNRSRGSFQRRSDARPARTRRHGYGSASRFAPDDPEVVSGRVRESDVAWWAVRDWQQTARAAVRVAAGRAAARAGDEGQPELFSADVDTDPAPVAAPGSAASGSAAPEAAAPEPEPEAAAPAEPAAAEPEAPAEEPAAPAASAKRTSAASTTTSRATAKTTAKSATRSRSKTAKSSTAKSKAQSGTAKPRRKSTTREQAEPE